MTNWEYAEKQGYKRPREPVPTKKAYNNPLPKNVVLTSIELGGIGWFTSIISEVHDQLYPGLLALRWKYEQSRFEATRHRRPLPKGWITTWNAPPDRLLERGFDKVIILQREKIDAYIGMAMFMYPDLPIDQVKNVNERFFRIINRKWEIMEKAREIKDDRLLYVHFNDLNNHTVKTFNKVFDFLEFTPNNRPKIIPVKVWRNWECYSNVQKSGGTFFEEYDPLFKLKEKYSFWGMMQEFFYKDVGAYQDND